MRTGFDHALDSLVKAEAEIDELKAELTRITALLEDRPSLAMRIRMAIYEWDNNVELQKTEHSTFVADRLIAYLKGKE